MTDTPDWAGPVAAHAITTYGQVSPQAQTVLAIGVTLVCLAAIAAWYGRGARPAAASAGMETALVAIVREFGTQVAGMRDSVETLTATMTHMQSVITGCQTCPWHPNAKERDPDV